MNNEEDLPAVAELEAEQGNGKQIGLGSSAQEVYTAEELDKIRHDLGNKIYAAADLLEEHERYHGEGPGWGPKKIKRRRKRDSKSCLAKVQRLNFIDMVASHNGIGAVSKAVGCNSLESSSLSATAIL